MIALPYTDPPLTIHDDVAVVGPSRKLRGSGHGPAIDAHAEVVRFNRAPTLGYEADVGARTTLRALNSHTVANRPLGDGFPEADYDFVPSLQSGRVLIHGWFRGKKDAAGQPDALGPACVRHYLVHDELDADIGENDPFQPTMGAAFLLACARGGIRPTVYGFDLEDDAPRSHYWEPRPEKSTHLGHETELTALRALVTAGKIRLVE